MSEADTTSAPAEAPRHDEIQLVRYRLDRVLGRGGMGEVWSAFDRELKRRVAVKVMAGLDKVTEDQYQRFRREAQAIAQLRSPFVVQVYDHGISSDDIPFTVMELLEGEDLEQRLRRVRTMSIAGLAPILKQVARALEEAHSAGIVHRDLKPANVFLARHGSEVTAKVLDFGVAQLRASWWTEPQEQTRQLIGTPEYMSPEQAEAAPLDYRTDLWALAVIAYEALTGRSAFGGGGMQNTLLRICAMPHEAPSAVAGLSDEVDAFFQKALAKAPVDRFQSVQELVAAYDRLAPGIEGPKTTKVLVIDDEPDVAEMITQCFLDEVDSGELEFFFAENGSQALDQLSSHPDVDVALTDLNMPVMDGMAFLDRVGEVAPIVKPVVVSAYGDISNIRKAMNRGAFDFLVKPIDFDDLSVTIRKAAAHAQALRRALHTLDENAALRILVDNDVVRDLLPLVGSSAHGPVESLEATAAVLDVSRASGADDAQNAAERVELLNSAFDVIVPVLIAHRGMVVRFHGPTLFAVFREPHHTFSAVLACLRLRARLAEVGLGAQALRVGIASGQLTAAAVGAPSRRRFDYVAFGPAVSLAEQLLSHAPWGAVVVSEQVAHTLGEGAECEAVPCAPPEEPCCPLRVASYREEHFPALCSVVPPSVDVSDLTTVVALREEQTR